MSKAYRDDFPALKEKVHGKPLVYFDNAASTLKARPVIDSLIQHYEKETANIHRGVHFLSEQGTMKFEETRKTVQRFINAPKLHEVIFSKGTTESINMVAECFGRAYLKEGDEILMSTMEHHSNIVPWQMIAERTGAKVVEVPVTDDGHIDMNAYRSLLSSKTKMVSVAYISNSLGTVNPVKEIISLAHEFGAKTLIDAAQAVAHKKVDVQDLDCDFLVFSSHKIFGPTGVGVLYGKEELLNEMPPYQGGGDMIDKVSFAGTTYNDLPHKFEAGTPHIAGVIALKAALDYVSDIGLEKIDAMEAELLNYATEKLQNIEGLTIYGPEKNKASVISFGLEGVHHHDLGTLLDQQGIAIRTGHHCTQPLMERLGVTGTSRASFCFYNTKEEIDYFVEALIKARDLLC